MVTARDDEGHATVRQEIPHDHLYEVTGLSSSNLEKIPQDPPSNFEEAIAATGYGWFNIALTLCALPAYWSAITVTSSTSYIYIQAQCDMNLSLLDMGTVNAISYGGMISSAMIWGFLSDTLGRRKIMVWGFLASGLIEILAAMSQNFTMLMVTRFASGFLFNGPFAVLISYIAELHRTDLRARVILLTSLFYSLANILLPIVAWSILTQKIHFFMFGDKIEIHSWNIFLLATATLPLISGLAISFLPESPKFLMSRGRNDEAMEVFRKIYKWNTGKPKAHYPVKILAEEKSEHLAQGVAALSGGFSQLAPLFKLPHVPWLLLMCMIRFGSLFGSNTIRLWYPQLAAMIGSKDNSTLCSAITSSPTMTQSNNVTEELCEPIVTDLPTYLQSAVVGSGSVLTYLIGSVLITKSGKKMVAGICGIFSAAIIIMMPVLGSGSVSVVVMVTCSSALTSLGGASLSSIAVELFPTSLRVMAMATFFMTGRMGTIWGTVIFPALIEYGCLPPFITIASVLAVCGFACFLLPNTTLRKLE